MKVGRIVNIKRFEIHDGDGIRTTVFLKGCPLSCLWCHNPECIGFKPQLSYLAHKCIGCGACVSVCPSGAHTATDGVHAFDRAKCVACGKCAENCLGEALTLYGTDYTAGELAPILAEDKPFFDQSGGGVTVSGGEPLSQPDFVAELLAELHQLGIHTAVDTCGFAPRAALEKVVGDTDLFLFDIKAIDPALHKRLTGQDNAIILDNLRYLDSIGKRVEIRIPLIPTLNDGEIDAIGKFLSLLKHPIPVKVLPYHALAKAKYQSLDMHDGMPEGVDPPDDAARTAAEEKLHTYGIQTIR